MSTIVRGTYALEEGHGPITNMRVLTYLEGARNSRGQSVLLMLRNQHPPAVAEVPSSCSPFEGRDTSFGGLSHTPIRLPINISAVRFGAGVENPCGSPDLGITLRARRVGPYWPPCPESFGRTFCSRFWRPDCIPESRLRGWPPMEPSTEEAVAICRS